MSVKLSFTIVTRMPFAITPSAVSCVHVSLHTLAMGKAVKVSSLKSIVCITILRFHSLAGILPQIQIPTTIGNFGTL